MLVDEGVGTADGVGGRGLIMLLPLETGCGPAGSGGPGLEAEIEARPVGRRGALPAPGTPLFKAPLDTLWLPPWLTLAVRAFHPVRGCGGGLADIAELGSSEGEPLAELKLAARPAAGP